MAKRGIWREMWQQAVTSPYLMLLFVSSILLSLASFYTTYEGITPFVRFAIVALFITTAIQSLLFVVSWRLGFMFAGKEDIARVDIGVFVVCFLLSVFFSFNSLFNMIFVEERQQQASLGRTRDGATAVVDNVGQRLKGDRARLVEALRASDDYATWRRDVLAIADTAQRVGPRLRKKVAQQQVRRREEYERKAEAARDLVARKGTMEEEIATLEQELEALESSPPDGNLEEPRRQVRELELRISAKEAELDAEMQGIAESGRSGRGPKWRKKDKERRILVNRREKLEEEIRIRTQQIEDYEQRQRELSETLLKTKELYANIDTEIERRRAVAKAAREALENFGSGGVAGTVQALREYPNRFEERSDVGQLEQAEDLCTQLADEMEALEINLGGRSCDRGPIMDKVAPIVETNRALAALDRQCLGADAPALHELDFAKALAAARQCLDLSRLPYRQVQDLREELDRLEREEGPNASEFTRTTNALFAGEKDGYLALVLAIAMDLLVLFTGLIGAKSATATFAIRVLEVERQDDPEVATIKTLLKYLDPFDQKIDGVRYEAKIDLDRIPDPRIRDSIGSLLVRNRSTGLVLVSPENPERYFLRYGAQEQLETQLEKRRQTTGEPVSRAATGQRRYSSADTNSQARKRGRQTPGRSPFYDPGERSLDHHDPRWTMGTGPAVTGIGTGGARAAEPTVASSAFDPYTGKSETGLEGAEPDVRPGLDEAPAAPVAAEPDREEAPTPSTESESGKSDENLELAYGFLSENEPGKPASGDS
ncbi:MAG: hypothetical protein LGR52_15080 [Candidatus Thiosymbion ectosymbiont of Robbea hypermnestra]|nr:hypothetical protein [Candidatus Thiosymbion ectosymbiont of Robbea hypermnestra]